MTDRLIGRFFRDQSGATAIEYGLIASMIALAIIASLVLFSDSVIGMFGYIESQVSAAMSNSGEAPDAG